MGAQPLTLSSRAADSLKRVGREMTKLVPSANRRVKPKGAPGLASETWDPSNQFPLETPTLLFVIRRPCDSFDLFVFSAYPTGYISPPNKAVILSEALRRSIANRRLYGAQSKDPGDACSQMLLGAFRPRTNRLPAVREKPRRPSAFLPQRFLRLYSCTSALMPMEPHRPPVRITTHESGRHSRLEQPGSTGAR
jgi:hypothetical protein